MTPSALVASTSTSFEHVSTGAGESRTVTSKEQEASLPAASFAVTVTAVFPRGKSEAEAWLYVTVGDTVTSSFAVASAQVALAPEAEVASAVTVAGHVSVGGVVSAGVIGARV